MPWFGLQEGQVERLRREAEALLAQVGCRVRHAGLRQQCRRLGAVVDEAAQQVRFPAELLRQLLAQAPGHYAVAGINGQAWDVGAGGPHLLSIITDPWVLDYASGKLRRPSLADVECHTAIAQSLPRVAGISLMEYPVTDADGPVSLLLAQERHLCGHDRHIFVYVASWESYLRWLRLHEALAPAASAPLYSVAVAALSPLEVSSLNAELLLSACAHGFPVVPTVCPMAGSTSPYTRAATLLQGHAEVLMLAALTQAVRPGHPFLYALGPSVTDHRDGHDQYYTLDKVLWKVAGVQLAKSYGLPAAAECGGTMAPRYDMQSGAETMLFMLAARASGAQVLAGLGSCCNAVTISAEMMLVQAAWLDASEHLVRGIDLDDERLGLASLVAAGPGGAFLTDDLTLRFLRGGEFFSHPRFDYDGERGRGQALLERAHAEVQRLASEAVSPVPPPTRERIAAFYREERRQLA